MEDLTIKCISCGQAWMAALPLSDHEQQAIESCPCPGCGAYTLCCQQPSVEAELWHALDVRSYMHTETAL